MFPLLNKTITKDELNGNGKISDFWTMNGDVVCVFAFTTPNICHFKSLNGTAVNYVWEIGLDEKKNQQIGDNSEPNSRERQMNAAVFDSYFNKGLILSHQISPF